ncbi:hypothetical protein HHI36_013348, partial [Cryptolaemus montrouzieri]
IFEIIDSGVGGLDIVARDKASDMKFLAAGIWVISKSYSCNARAYLEIRADNKRDVL